MQRHITLMIVIDEPLYRDGLAALLAGGTHDVRCVAARTPAHALALLRADSTPHWLVAHHELAGGLTKLSWLQQIGVEWPTIQRVLLTAVEDPALAQWCRCNGLAGYFCKTMEPERWLQALDAVRHGGRYFVESGTQNSSGQYRATAPLNERQITVLQLVSVGYGNRQIAEKLHLTERTVKYHLSETYQRLASSSRTEAVAKAAALGLIRLQNRLVSDL